MNIRHSFVSALRTPVALGYLLLVAAIGVWVAVDTLAVTHTDTSFAGVWLFLATAPVSVLFAWLPAQLALIGIPVAAVAQAALLGAAYRGLTRTRRLSAS